MAIVTGLAVVVVALALSVVSLLSVPDDAQAAKDDLTAAMGAFRSGDVAAARGHVQSAREHIDAAQDDAQGLGGDLLSLIPFLGTPVDDARHLTQALDDATTVAEVGVELYPEVSGPDATLFQDNRIDQATLQRVITGGHDIADHLRSADEELAGVEGTTPFVGDTIDARRDAAAAQLEPVVDGLGRVEPLLDQLPEFFGFEGRRSYLLALLNPAELRYSGGAALAFAPMSWDEGAVEVGDQIDMSGLDDHLTWKGVPGNRFHRDDSMVANSTFAPSWSVSGKELLRAWQADRDTLHDGVIAVDVVALARLVEATGPVTVQGYGELTSDNLVKTLIGSYDDYYPDPTAQDALNSELLPAFQAQLFGGGHYVDKARALGEAADSRHFATFFRDPDLQDAFAAIGLDGDLAQPVGDYFGVFTQNTNGSKVDYYQRRTVSLDVTLHEDGSATDRLDALIDNDTPPYAVPGPDPRTGYFTRWAGMALTVFVPRQVTDRESMLLGKATDPPAERFGAHRFMAQHVLLEPASTGRLQMEYTIPDAATSEENGGLTYHLAFDPQGTVHPAAISVTVHLPDGYRATALPEGWSADGSTLTFQNDALESSQEWEIPLAPSS